MVPGDGLHTKIKYLNFAHEEVSLPTIYNLEIVRHFERK